MCCNNDGSRIWNVWQAFHVPRFLSLRHILFCFVFAEASRARRYGCKEVVGIVPSLRPSEIWGEDEVSLKRRYITGSHVAHVTGSVWQRLLGVRVQNL